MERCKTCKHWEKLGSGVDEVIGTGKCNAALQFWNSTKWDVNSPKRVMKPLYASKLVFVLDGGDGGDAELITTPDFGCVLEEEMP